MKSRARRSRLIGLALDRVIRCPRRVQSDAACQGEQFACLGGIKLSQALDGARCTQPRDNAARRGQVLLVALTLAESVGYDVLVAEQAHGHQQADHTIGGIVRLREVGHGFQQRDLGLRAALYYGAQRGRTEAAVRGEGAQSGWPRLTKQARIAIRASSRTRGLSCAPFAISTSSSSAPTSCPGSMVYSFSGASWPGPGSVRKRAISSCNCARKRSSWANWSRTPAQASVSTARAAALASVRPQIWARQCCFRHSSA